ncbi:MAG TPA: hypothetical protein VF482_22285 [Trebonia sp.]
MTTSRYRLLAGVMSIEAVTLAVMSSLHFGGLLHPSTDASAGTDAGIAEGILCFVLLWGASGLVRRRGGGRRLALGTTAFTIAGFCLGLSITARVGDVADVAYHATMLPILAATFVLLLRSRDQSSGVTAKPFDRAGRR